MLLFASLMIPVGGGININVRMLHILFIFSFPTYSQTSFGNVRIKGLFASLMIPDGGGTNINVRMLHILFIFSFPTYSQTSFGNV